MNKVFRPFWLLASISIPTSLITWVLLENQVSSQKQVDSPIQAPVNTELSLPHNFKVHAHQPENPYIKGFLPDVKPESRNFRVYDNGIFKVKIDEGLIGKDKFYSDNSKADFQASEIIKKINYGPAIFHLDKGIQILKSDHPESLGGQDGVQVAVSNRYGSADDAGIISTTSLVTHEYGHHETMWDTQNQMGDISGDMLGPLMEQVLRNAGYPKIADITKSVDYSKNSDDSFDPAILADIPTAYGSLDFHHDIFKNSNYPFDDMEIATRILNILSFTTPATATPQDIYEPGKFGNFSNGPAFDLPPFLTSDTTIRHFANDSVFGEGKDHSRINKLIKFYMENIFGEGMGTIQIHGELHEGKIDGISLDSLGFVENLDSIELQDATGKVLASSKVKSFKSQFGFKNELISDVQTTKYDDLIKSVDFNPSDNGPINGVDGLMIVGKDATGKRVDISKLQVKGMGALGDKYGFYQKMDKNNKPVQPIVSGHFGLEPVGDHFVFNQAI